MKTPALALLLVLAGSCAAQAAVIPPGAELIDEGTLDPASETASYFHSKVLNPDVEYTIVVSGTMTEPYQGSNKAGSRSYDALYCSGSLAGDSSCGNAGAPSKRSPAL